MKKWATSGAILLAGVAALAGCGTTTTDRATSPRVVTHDTSKTPRLAAETTLQKEFNDNAIRNVTMLTTNGGWAYSREHVWSISDAGATWELIWHHTVPILAFATPSATDAWIVTAQAGARHCEVWHTSNGGRVWVSATVQTHWQILEASIAVTADGHGHLLLSGDPATMTAPQMLVNIEHGRVQTRPSFSTKSGGLNDIVFPTQRDGVAVDQAVAGAQNITPPLFRTTNGGVTWHPIALPAPPHVSAPASDKGGPTFVVENPVNFVTQSTAYVALVNPTAMLYRTTNAGASWSPINTPPVTTGYGISTTWLTPERGWVMAGSKGPSVLWGTANGGKTWIRLSADNFVTVPQFSSTSTGWALIVPQHSNANGGPVTFVRTTNGGKTWTPVKIH